MKYNPTDWIDNIRDIDTDEVIQEGTPLSARNLNNMEDGIEKNDIQARKSKNDVISLAVEVSILKDASINNITSNVFFENFKDLSSVVVSNGIYDSYSKRLYA